MWRWRSAAVWTRVLNIKSTFNIGIKFGIESFNYEAGLLNELNGVPVISKQAIFISYEFISIFNTFMNAKFDMTRRTLIEWGKKTWIWKNFQKWNYFVIHWVRYDNFESVFT